MAFRVPEKFRVTSGHQLATSAADGNNGLFRVRLRHAQTVRVIASDGEGWEHVSVSRDDRPPTWDEMCQVKALFWGEEDCVVQYHPPRSEYVNVHPNCLHLWRPADRELPLPPRIMV